MLVVLNEWSRLDDITTELTITGSYVYKCLIPTDLVPKLQELTWCWEQDKGQVYASDLSMVLPTLLGAASPRVYLWKYIIYLKTGRVAKSWRRTRLDNYIPNHGEVIFKDIVSLQTS